jgi:hypothetical protein
VAPFSLRDLRVAATLLAFQFVFASLASLTAFSLAQLPLGLACLNPALKLQPLHLQALCSPVLLHAACFHLPWREKLFCLAADAAAFLLSLHPPPNSPFIPLFCPNE